MMEWGRLLSPGASEMLGEASVSGGGGLAGSLFINKVEACCFFYRSN